MWAEVLLADGKRKSLPATDVKRIYRLFRSWGVAQGVLRGITIVFGFASLLGKHEYGWYYGERNGTHLILLNFNLLGEDTEKDLWATIVHELRHAYHNIVRPGRSVNCKGWRYRLRNSKCEEADCRRAERKHAKFKLGVVWGRI